MTEAAIRGTISGRVQGVAFRWSTAREASRLDVSGWVRNLRDGRVEVFVQGSANGVAAMERFLASGPGSARVESMDLETAAADPGLQQFEIR